MHQLKSFKEILFEWLVSLIQNFQLVVTTNVRNYGFKWILQRMIIQNYLELPPKKPIYIYKGGYRFSVAWIVQKTSSQREII